MVDREHEAFARDCAGGLDGRAELVCVDARVRARAAFDVHFLVEYIFKRLGKDLLHGHGVLLHLPAVVRRAVKAEAEKQIAQRVPSLRKPVNHKFAVRVQGFGLCAAKRVRNLEHLVHHIAGGKFGVEQKRGIVRDFGRQSRQL